MALVVCDEVTAGLRDSERTVAIKDVNSNRQYLRVGAGMLTPGEAGRFYLTVGVVHQDPKSGALLIELPHEADSGAHRLWVWPSDFLRPVAGLL